MPVKYTSSTVLTLHCHRRSAALSGCHLHPASQTTTAGRPGWEGHESAKNLENNCYVTAERKMYAAARNMNTLFVQMRTYELSK